MPMLGRSYPSATALNRTPLTAAAPTTWTLTGASAGSTATVGALAWLAPITGTAAGVGVTAGDVYRSGGRSSPLLTSAQAVTTGPASSTLAVPAQAGVQAGDLILIWAATGG